MRAVIYKDDCQVNLEQCCKKEDSMGPMLIFPYSSIMYTRDKHYTVIAYFYCLKMKEQI